MTVREPVVAGRFYPGTDYDCEEMIRSFSNKTPENSLNKSEIHSPLGGIVPHAGWVYSGAIASSVVHWLKKVENSPVETIVLFGAVHVPGVFEATISPDEYWKTPMGLISIDREFAEKLPFPQHKKAHQGEHSIEVQVPIIQEAFGSDIKLLPIAVPPNEKAIEVGETVAKTAQKLGRNVLLLGSSDLTHYGDAYYFTPKGEGIPALNWVKEENDARMVQLMTQLEKEQILSEAQSRQNACGAGAITATLAGVQILNPQAKASLNQYATSFDVKPDPIPSSFVGYAGIVIYS